MAIGLFGECHEGPDERGLVGLGQGGEQVGLHYADVVSAGGEERAAGCGEGDDPVAQVVGVWFAAQQCESFEAVKVLDGSGLVPPDGGGELRLGGCGPVFEAAEDDVVLHVDSVGVQQWHLTIRDGAGEPVELPRPFLQRTFMRAPSFRW